MPALCRLYSRDCGLSQELAELADRMLQIVPVNRISLHAVAACPWLCRPDSQSGARAVAMSRSGDPPPPGGVGAVGARSGAAAAAKITRLSRADATVQPRPPPSPLGAMVGRARFAFEDAPPCQPTPVTVRQLSDLTRPPPAPELLSTIGRRALRSSLPDSLPSSIRDSLRLTTASEQSLAPRSRRPTTGSDRSSLALTLIDTPHMTPPATPPDTPPASPRPLQPGVETGREPLQAPSPRHRRHPSGVNSAVLGRIARGRASPGRLPSSPLATLPATPPRPRGTIPASPLTTCSAAAGRRAPWSGAPRVSSGACPESPADTASSVPNSSTGASPDASPHTSPHTSPHAPREASAGPPHGPSPSPGATPDAPPGAPPGASPSAA